MYDVGLTKNYCITVSIKKISSIHKIILKIQQILGSHKLNLPIFWPCPPKNHWICTNTQKISSFHLFVLEIQSIIESCDQTGHTHFLSLGEFVSTCKKSGNFMDLFWRYCWLEILQSDWLRIFWPIYLEQNFSWICTGTQQINFLYRINSVKVNDHIFQ